MDNIGEKLQTLIESITYEQFCELTDVMFSIFEEDRDA